MDYLLTSTVTWIKAGAGKGRLQVVPELIKVKTGAGTWQQSFDADLTDVFQVQRYRTKLGRPKGLHGIGNRGEGC